MNKINGSEFPAEEVLENISSPQKTDQYFGFAEEKEHFLW